MLKNNFNLCIPKLIEQFNSCISNGVVLDERKLVGLSPIFKYLLETFQSKDRTTKINYRPVQNKFIECCEINHFERNKLWFGYLEGTKGPIMTMRFITISVIFNIAMKGLFTIHFVIFQRVTFFPFISIGLSLQQYVICYLKRIWSKMDS